MNPNVWNIKEILSIPTVSVGKSSSKMGPTSDYSSLTDSQFLFGSQFWPDQSQGLSQEMCFQSKAQQSSQEVNDSKISTSYHTKPLLFGGDLHDKGRGPSFTSGKTKGVLDRFEEDQRNAKEKEESEMLTSRHARLEEYMENIKLTLDRTNGSSESAKKAILEHVDSFMKTIQDDVASLRESGALQLDTLVNKLASQTRVLKEMEDREKKMGLEMITLQSCVEGLQRDLESLRAEHSKEQCMMGEALSLLDTLVSSHRSVARTTDRMAQTSPHLIQSAYLVSKEMRYFEGLRLCAAGQLPGEGVDSASIRRKHQHGVDPLRNPWSRSYETRSAVSREAGFRGEYGLQTEQAVENHPEHNQPTLFPKDFGRKGKRGARNRPRKSSRGVQPCKRRRVGSSRALREGNPGTSAGASDTLGQLDPRAARSPRSDSHANATASWMVPFEGAQKLKGLWQLFNISEDSD